MYLNLCVNMVRPGAGRKRARKRGGIAVREREKRHRAQHREAAVTCVHLVIVMLGHGWFRLGSTQKHMHFMQSESCPGDRAPDQAERPHHGGLEVRNGSCESERLITSLMSQWLVRSNSCVMYYQLLCAVLQL